MTAIGWRDGAWDRCILGGDLLPGIVRVTVTPARDVTSVASPGKDVPAIKDGGNRGATVDLEIEIWTTHSDLSQLLTLARILSRISPRRPGGVKEPLSIVHPATALAGVQHIYSGTYTIPPPVNGRLIVPVKALEWFPEEDVPTQQGAAPGAPAGGGSAAGPEGMGDGGDFGDGYVPPPDPENLGADYP